MTKYFKRTGIFFIPARSVSWLFVFVMTAYSIYLFIDIDSHSHSVSDTLMNFGINVLLVWIGYSVVAFVLSAGNRD